MTHLNNHTVDQHERAMVEHDTNGGWAIVYGAALLVFATGMLIGYGLAILVLA